MGRLSAVVLGMFGCLFSAALIPMIASLSPGWDRYATGTVLAAYRDPFSIIRPIRLSSSPDLVLASGTIWADATAAERGLTKLVLDQPRFVLDASSRRLSADGPVGPPSADERDEILGAVGPLVSKLHGLRVDSVQIRRGVLDVTYHGGRSAPVEVMDLDITGFSKGQLHAVGRIAHRGQSFALDASVATQAAKDQAAGDEPRRAVRIGLRGNVLTANFDGSVDASGPMQVRGLLEATVPSLWGLGDWLGADVARSATLRDVSIKGEMNWARSVLAIEKAVVSFDGQETASGILSLSHDAAGPVLEATLAFNTFELAPYLLSSSASGPSTLPWRHLALAVPNARHIRADVRMSAGRVTYNGTPLGKSAISFSLAEGKLHADVAEIEHPGGKSSAQISIDSSVTPPRLTIRSKSDMSNVGPLLAEVASIDGLNGRGSVQIDLAGTGNDVGEFLSAANGRIGVATGPGSQVGIDLRGLRAAIGDVKTPNWATLARSTSAIDALDVRAVVQNGRVHVDGATLRAGVATYSASGHLDPSSRELDLKVTLREGRNSERASERSAIVRGAWHGPAILSARPEVPSP
jgi:hypothetical protein